MDDDYFTMEEDDEWKMMKMMDGRQAEWIMEERMDVGRRGRQFGIGVKRAKYITKFSLEGSWS